MKTDLERRIEALESRTTDPGFVHFISFVDPEIAAQEARTALVRDEQFDRLDDESEQQFLERTRAAALRLGIPVVFLNERRIEAEDESGS